jgi:hypothetical protein
MPTKREGSVQHAFRPLKTAIVATLTGLAAVGLSWLSGCTTDANKAKESASHQPPSRTLAPTAVLPSASTSSLARTPKEYRKDAASHLYGINKERIFQGRLPPMLQAVGVLDVDIDRQGQVKALSWKRPPKHVPEVMAEIERMVKAAAPYPAPKNLSQVTYTDVWLWHKSGKFQLDTLTEGQD